MDNHGGVRVQAIKLKFEGNVENASTDSRDESKSARIKSLFPTLPSEHPTRQQYHSLAPLSPPVNETQTDIINSFASGANRLRRDNNVPAIPSSQQQTAGQIKRRNAFLQHQQQDADDARMHRRRVVGVNNTASSNAAGKIASHVKYLETLSETTNPAAVATSPKTPTSDRRFYSPRQPQQQSPGVIGNIIGIGQSDSGVKAHLNRSHAIKRNLNLILPPLGGGGDSAGVQRIPPYQQLDLNSFQKPFSSPYQQRHSDPQPETADIIAKALRSPLPSGPPPRKPPRGFASPGTNQHPGGFYKICDYDTSSCSSSELSISDTSLGSRALSPPQSTNADFLRHLNTSLDPRRLPIANTTTTSRNALPYFAIGSRPQRAYTEPNVHWGRGKDSPTSASSSPSHRHRNSATNRRLDESSQQ